jgi:hypothetical protein
VKFSSAEFEFPKNSFFGHVRISRLLGAATINIKRALHALLLLLLLLLQSLGTEDFNCFVSFRTGRKENDKIVNFELWKGI